MAQINIDTKLRRSFSAVKQDMFTLSDELYQIKSFIQSLKNEMTDREAESIESIDASKKEISDIKKNMAVLADELKNIKKENAQIKELSIALIQETEKTNESILDTFGRNIKELGKETKTIKEQLLALAQNRRKQGKQKKLKRSPSSFDFQTPSSLDLDTSSITKKESKARGGKGFFSRIIDYFAED